MQPWLMDSVATWLGPCSNLLLLLKKLGSSTLQLMTKWRFLRKISISTKLPLTLGNRRKHNTVDNTSFLQIKGEKTAAALWMKLTSIHGNKGAQFEEYLLGKLQIARYAESEDIRTHLTTMKTLRECLSEI